MPKLYSQRLSDGLSLDVLLELIEKVKQQHRERLLLERDVQPGIRASRILMVLLVPPTPTTPLRPGL
jgi:hypothetical protein